MFHSANRHAHHALLDSEHCRAICDEIGERLRAILDRDAMEPSQQLLQLLSQLEQQERDAPSIVPSLDDMQWLPADDVLEDAM